MLKNFWYVACTSAELAQQPLGRIICNEPVVIYRQADGAPAILKNVCPHRQAPLSMGVVEGNTLRCIYHGMTFDAGGKCVHIPSQDVIPPRSHIRSYPAQERYGLVWIFTGNPELADNTPLPARPWRESPEWNTDVVQYFHVNAAAELMNDNLLDLSHVAFLHASTIGFDARRLEKDPLQIDVDDGCIRTTRVFKNTTQAPAHKAWRALAEPVDRTQLAEWTAPYNVTVLVRNENAEEQVDLRADHFITPETDTSHHYYIALSRNFRTDDTAFSEKLDVDTRRVHTEDVDIAQAQQTMKPWVANEPQMALKADKAVTAAHRMLAALAEKEAATKAAHG